MSIAAKIREVMKEVGYLQKDAKTDSGAIYTYLSEEKAVSVLHEACTKAGIVIHPLSMETLARWDMTTSKGNVLHVTDILVTYHFIDADDDSKILVQALGEGADTGDKGVNKAMTAAFKYALRQSFMISTGDDPDHEVSEESSAPTPQQVTEAARSVRQKLGPGRIIPPQDSYDCEWPGCLGKITGYTAESGKVYTALAVAGYSIKDCDEMIYCNQYGHKKAYIAGARPPQQEESPAEEDPKVEEPKRGVTPGPDRKAGIEALAQAQHAAGLSNSGLAKFLRDEIGLQQGKCSEMSLPQLEEATELLKGMAAADAADRNV